MKRKIKILLPIIITLVALVALMVTSSEAMQSAQDGISTCVRLIIPSLLPFLVISSLLSQLGLPRYIGKIMAPIMRKLFGVGGNGAAAFILGLSGGYPLGATVITEMYSLGQLEKNEAERLLAFCNNSGPAFIIGAAGVGVFHSPKIGLILYVIHALAAVIIGILMSGSKHEVIPNVSKESSTAIAHIQTKRFTSAFSIAVRSATSSIIAICSFVVLFSILTGVLSALGVYSAIVGSIAAKTCLELSWVHSFLDGLFELGSGIASMKGLNPTAINLALAAFTLGWGGLSVQCQVLGIIEGTGLKSTRHFVGRLLHGIVSAVLALLVFAVIGM